MTRITSSLERIIRGLGKLPGVGQKTAQRLAFFLLKKDNIDLNNLASAISTVKNGITFCFICHNMAETNPCSTCGDAHRDHSLICFVEQPLDAQAIDKTCEFNGVFHVLRGLLNPL